jgi:cytochrome P450
MNIEQIDFSDSRIKANPYPVYQEMMAREPILWNESLGSWMILSYEDIVNALKDKRFSSFRVDSIVNRLPENERNAVTQLKKYLSLWALLVDPPTHTRLRALIVKAFSSRIVENLKPSVEQITTDLLSKVIDQGSMDIVNDLAIPLPIMVIAEILGFPKADWKLLKIWSDGIAGFITCGKLSLELASHAEKSIIAMNDYFRSFIEQKRRVPASDLVSSLITTQEGGQILDEDELLAMCSLLLFAGNETTTNLIGNSFLALLQNPDEHQKLEDDLSLVDSAVEECLRYDSPVHAISRAASESIEIKGKRIQKGQRVLLVLGAGNRDPKFFSDPNQLDIRRAGAKNLSFGNGIHFCPGAMLAKLETKIALRSTITQMPALKLKEKSEIVWLKEYMIRGLVSLPVCFRAR